MKYKLKKQVLFILFLLIIIVSLAGCTAEYQLTKDEYIIENAEVKIIKIDSFLGENLRIPSKIDNYPVTEICDGALSNNSNIVTVIIPKFVKVIGRQAFYGMSNLKTVTFEKDSKILSIGEDAFADDSSLSTIELPEGLISIGNSAFLNASSLESIAFPKSLQSIGWLAFAHTLNIKTIFITENLNQIGESAFLGMTLLESFSIETNNQSFAVVEGVLFNFNKTRLIQYPAGKTSSDFEIPEGVNTIGKGAFVDSSFLNSIIIPNSVVSIERGAFQRSALQSIFIPISVTNIEGYVFRKPSQIVIYAETSSKPEGWDNNWNVDDIEVQWGATN